LRVAEEDHDDLARKVLDAALLAVHIAQGNVLGVFGARDIDALETGLGLARASAQRQGAPCHGGHAQKAQRCPFVHASSTR
jgi:hypothetical protein